MHDPVLEPAAGLLDVVNDAELEAYLEGLVTRSARRAGVGLSPTATRALVGRLATTARATVPTLAILTHAGDGDRVGRESDMVTNAARTYGLELEGLSADDRDLEIAREFVSHAQAATAGLTGEPSGPTATSRALADRDARRYRNAGQPARGIARRQGRPTSDID